MNFLIIGIGNIGLRHIQGLSKLNNRNIKFYICDKNFDYKKRFNIEIDILKKKFQFFETNNFKEFKDIYFNLIIISTTATNRVEILKNALSELKSRYILIEKPICQSLSELRDLKKINNKNIYINFPRRYCEWHNKIRNKMIELVKNNVFKINISGGKIGLACNTSHYIDMVYFWTNKLPKKIDTSNLDIWHESKRKGFYDLNGKLEINFNDNHKLNIISYDNSQDEIIEIFDSDNNFIGLIDNYNGIANFYDGEKIQGKTKLQSESTNILFQQIKSDDTHICKLDIAVAAYELLLNALINNWNESKNDNINKIMIT